MMGARTLKVAVAVEVCVAASVVGACGATDEEPRGDGSCSQRVKYEGTIYEDRGLADPKSVGRKLGTASLVFCDDGAESSADSHSKTDDAVTVFLLDSIDDQVAIAVRDPMENLEVFAASSADLAQLESVLR